VAYEQAFGPIPPGLLVCHRCDERLCVNPEHLFVGTQKDNIADMISKGRACRGVLHHSVRLTEDQVRQIRVADGTQREIAALFGISQTNVSQIRQRKGWKQLP
jgi:hypothetical protein